MSTQSVDDEYAFVAEFYDHVEPYRLREDVAFFVDMAKQSNGPVLEIGCGTGRVLIPTAQAGIEITGLDASSAMLSLCREKLVREPQEVQSRVELFQGDMRDFSLGKQFSLVTIPFRPFLHLLTVEDQLACLSCIRRHLMPGGRLILDVFNPSLEFLIDPSAYLENGNEPAVTLPDGRSVLRRQRIASRDRARQVAEVELIYYVSHPDGRQERLVHAFPFRYLFRYEAEHLLERAGFHLEDVYSDYDKSPFGAKYPGELIVVAKKNDR